MLDESELQTRISGKIADQAPMFAIGLGHGAIHWTAGVFYMLLPFIANSFDLTYAQAGVAVSVFHLAATLTNFASGPTIDITGRLGAAQVIALLVSAATLALFPVADAFPLLLLLVVAMAMANNFWHPAAISYLSLRYPSRRGYALSIHALGANGGDAAAPIAVGILLLSFSWPVGAAVSAIPVLFVAGIVATLAWRDRAAAPKQAGTAKNGLAVGEYLREVAGALKNRSVLSLAFMAGLRTMTQNGLMAFLPLYLIDDQLVGTVFAGLVLSVMQGAGMASAPIGGIMSDRKGRKPVTLVCLALAACLTLLLAFLPGGLPFLLGAAALGFAIFAARPVIHSWMMDITPPKLGASATSLLFGVQSGLSVLAPLAAGIVADQWGLGATLYLFAAFCTAAALATIFIPARKLASNHDM